MANIQSKLPVRGVSSDIQVGVADTGDTRIDPAVTLAQGSNTAGQTGTLAQGATTTAAPSYTTGQTNPLSLTTGGLLRVDGSGATQPVSGTVTADAGTGTFDVNLVQVLGTATAVNTGNSDAGTQRVVLASDQPTVSMNEAQVAGTATAVNTGNANNGTQRVVIASDQPALSVTFSPGNLNLTPAYNRGVGIASNGTSTHTWTPSANAIVQRIYISGSGQMNGEIQYGTTGAEATCMWLFATKGDLNPYIEFPTGLSVTTAQSIKIIRTNDDNQTQDLYSWIIYKNA